MIVEAILYQYRSGICSRSTGPGREVWTSHRRMVEESARDTVLASLTAATDAKGLIDYSPSVDSTIALAHHSTRRIPSTSQGIGSNYKNLLKEPAHHGIERSQGGLITKIHQLIDGARLPLVDLITAD